ncbi:MAG: preprotein translocase subunit SecY [Deltaproteobacteria bacterium]|nr:preprotein translocase subunit SecY [Deltaproteobacteria bacterium]MBW2051742.1 preprotein translocase subunit SecY [Deltaproteobacteria bacterium]MBW2140281.1 preprotein translocase subunit SecY [Deltaproteobacteria bacterium]MBW2322124.1 preprotein translocase subunit SecY [Deltaproteobacteria bacterium]
MIGGFQNIFKIKELKTRVLFTLAILAVYRLGVHVPTPGVDTEVLATFFDRANILGLLDMFAGGAWRRFSVFALGIMPYISASIILELLTVVVPHLERLKKEGDAGRKKITQYARYGTIVLSVVQGFAIAVGLESMSGPDGAMVVLDPGWSFRLMTVITLTSGTAFIMWLGERITERGIGNGISVIIFAGIIARFPEAIVKLFQLVRTGEMGPILVLAIGIFAAVVVGFIVFAERGQRRIPVQYAKRVVGRRVYGGQNTHLPLKINSSGVIPPIFASSILMFPATIAQFIPLPYMDKVSSFLAPGALLYNVLFVAFIFFFCYFYTAVTFNPVDVADNINKQGGSIPGIRAGKPTAQYIDKVLTRITFGGAVYVSIICVLPALLIQQFNVPFYFGGTGLLIVVGVALDTVGQIETHMLTRHYEGFLKKGMAGRVRR